MTAFVSLAELVARIPAGARLAVGGHHFARLPMAALRALCASPAGGLRWFSWGGGLPLEMLIEAGKVGRIDLCFSSLDLFGLPPRFRAAAEAGTIPVADWPALAMIGALEAAMRNLPAMPVQLPLGSDLATACPGLAPAGDGRTAMAAAVRPDVALLHAPFADAEGNVAIHGACALDVLLAGAARQVLVTVEEIVPRGALARMGRLTVIPRTQVSAIAHVPEGAAPASCLPHYVTDWKAIAGLLAGDSQIAEPAPVPGLLRRAAGVAEVDPGDFRIPAAGPAGVDEIMAVRLSRMLDDTAFASAGAVSPLANVAYRLAKATHAPHLMLATFTAGHVDVPGAALTLSLYEAVDAAQAAAHAGGEDTYAAWYQAGRVTHEIIGAAQIDRLGRVNNLMLTRPSGGRLRLAGQGGMADVANMHAHSVLYVTRHSPQSVVDRVAVASSARGVSGRDREAAGYRPGRVMVLTNLCLFEADETTGELVVTERMPGVTATDIAGASGFAPRFAGDCPEIALPDAATLALLRERIDPLGLRRTEFVPARDRTALLDAIIACDLEGTAAATSLTETRSRRHG
jgi:glutaconate CoA-transferase subunit A